MRMNFESIKTDKRECTLYLCDSHAAQVGVKNFLACALDADLYFGTPKLSEHAQVIGGNRVGTRFYNQTYDATSRSFVEVLLFEKVVEGGTYVRPCLLMSLAGVI